MFGQTGVSAQNPSAYGTSPKTGEELLIYAKENDPKVKIGSLSL